MSCAAFKLPADILSCVSEILAYSLACEMLVRCLFFKRREMSVVVITSKINAIDGSPGC